MVARNKALDVLRAIAIIMTFGRHMAKPIEANLPAAVYKVLRMWEKTGWAGVPLFFVLSGYLVSSLMFNEFQNTGGSIQFGRFYIRRGLKIYPAFYFLLICSIALSYADMTWFHQNLVPKEPVDTRTILSEIFFVQNYFDKIWSHVWSLAIEEHFYISLGIIIYLILKLYPKVHPGVELRNRFKPIVWVCCAVFAACLTLRYFYLAGQDRTMDERFAASGYTHLRIDSLFFGVFLAYFVKFRPESFLTWVKAHTWMLGIAGLLLVSPSLVIEETDTKMFIVGLTMMYCGFGCLLLFTLYHHWPPCGAIVTKSTDFLSYIGQNSYSIYLWHLPLMIIMEKRYGATQGYRYYVLIAAQNILGLFFGLIMAKLIEMPVLKLRDRYFKPTKALSAGVPEKA